MMTDMQTNTQTLTTQRRACVRACVIIIIKSAATKKLDKDVVKTHVSCSEDNGTDL